MGQRWNGQERNDGRLAFDETLLQCPQRILELSETVGRETAAQISPQYQRAGWRWTSSRLLVVESSQGIQSLRFLIYEGLFQSAKKNISKLKEVCY